MPFGFPPESVFSFVGIPTRTPIFGRQLQQVPLNPTMNAIEAMSAVGGGRRELWVRSEEVEPMDVLDRRARFGAGAATAESRRLFETFYTAKPDGLGMGLAIGRSIVEAHGRRLWATANAPHGAVFQF